MRERDFCGCSCGLRELDFCRLQLRFAGAGFLRFRLRFAGIGFLLVLAAVYGNGISAIAAAAYVNRISAVSAAICVNYGSCRLRFWEAVFCSMWLRLGLAMLTVMRVDTLFEARRESDSLFECHFGYAVSDILLGIF